MGKGERRPGDRVTPPKWAYINYLCAPFVLLPDVGQVRVLDRATRAPVKTIQVGGRPRNVAFTADGSLAVVANEEAVTFIHVP